ncbi:hypothetical protein ACTG9Q_28810 [Actinokineospora sp. 24-640]
MTALLERPSLEQDSRARNEAVAELVLLAIPSAITCARLLLELTTRQQGMAPTFVDAARDVLDELIAHAVASTGVVDPTPVQHLRSEQLTLLGIRLAYGTQTLRIEVWDTGNGPLDTLLATSPALAAVDHWAVDLPKPGQRVAWCMLSRESSAEQTTRLPVPMPRRPAPAAPGGPQAAVMSDPAVLQRILDGLRALDYPSQEK